jgi:hypothetical protein
MYAIIDSSRNNIIIQIVADEMSSYGTYYSIECPDNCKIGWYYQNGKFFDYPPPTSTENKLKAVSLLKETDWVTFPDVVDTSLTPHLLNQDEFIEYRRQLRAISVDPIDGYINWPVIPNEKWAK